ncbi:uncharacterized protein GGS25DRAFT_38951 [Hypoxylon fragiforme]|uniref:uncharacterized protein n=1 Tax=Hypoxylon fragiforme TaxID=63214 RepID=UPI0020C6BBA4|nr:uncharacterized protein GGS25DRAFT_38951 [Hypoxylon fragiforme]KAI2614202.1 hypothetical protein GGS25DRAFT_38951 [Hypoxylon fragiforme]
MFATMTDDTNETANATKTTPSSSHSTSTRRWTTSTEERKSQSTTKSTKTESKATKTSTSSTKKPEPTHPAGITCDLKKVGDESSEFKPRDYVKAAFEAGVYQYCRGDYGWLVRPDDRGSGSNYFWFDTKHTDKETGNLPAYCLGSAKGVLAQWSPKSQSLCSGGSGVFGSNSKIWLEVVPSDNQKGCKDLKEYKLPAGDDCVKNWNRILNECMKSGDPPHGNSGSWRESTDSGCFDWNIWGRKLT